jgi:TPP-dependent pyruvate/acetoin dehydrogenase alpha subunit
MNKLTEKNLQDFEEDIFNQYQNGKIKGVIHLSGGNEKPLIDIFKKIKEEDWVIGTHRNHYQSLLKSKSVEWTKKQIMEGHSMHIASKKYKIFNSSIVGGCIPIAVGIAMANKIRKQKGRVYCFIGDMASQMGCFTEAIKYSAGHNLKITFVIEDNEYGVYTKTDKVWGKKNWNYTFSHNRGLKLIKYKYHRKYPHHGTGQFVHF